MREPRDPEGSTERVAWSRYLKSWIKWLSVKQIVGFERSETSDGVIFKPKTGETTSDGGSTDNIPRWS